MLVAITAMYPKAKTTVRISHFSRFFLADIPAVRVCIFLGTVVPFIVWG
jgi:hypothetical protein